MQELRELQEKFLHHILHDHDDILPLVRDKPLAAGKLMQVYANNTYISLCEALSVHFPVVKKLVGEDYFEHMALGFVKENLPGQAMLAQFGELFPDYIAGHPVREHLPYLRDVAGLEWLIQEACQSADAQTLNAKRLFVLEGYSDVRFKLHPSVRLMQSEFPVLEIWRANQEGNEDVTVSLDSGPQQILVFRQDLQIVFLTLPEDVYQFVAAVKQQHSFLQALNQTNIDLNQIDLREFIQDCVNNQIIIAIEGEEL